jgi:DNA-binding GntR family transcriptional regulator
MSRGKETGLESKVVALSGSAISLTLSETIRIGLADDITTGRLRAGTEIDEQEVAARFGASRTPVREALRELAAEGLVVIEPRRGARVAEFTLERLGEMFEVMAETEATCARLATNRMTAVERFELQKLHRHGSDVVARGDVIGYDRLNRDFHSAIYRGTHNAFLAEHAASLRVRLAPFRRAQFRGNQRLRQSYDEHGGILQQMVRGDGEEAGRLMRAHMLLASAVFAEFLADSEQVPRGGDIP